MRRGKPAAELERRFLGLIERNRARIDRLVCAYAGDPADRDELRSEVYFQLWRSLPSFDRRASEDTWLYRVALNTVLLHRRKERSRTSRVETLRREPRPDAADTSRRLEAQERPDRLRAAMRGLSEGERAVLTLYLEELRYRQIADVTGLTESHVGVKLNRIRKKLARLLGGGER